MAKRFQKAAAFLTVFFFTASQIAWPEPSVPIDFNKAVQPVSEALQAESAESQEPTPKTSVDFLQGSPLSTATAEEGEEPPVILAAAQDDPAPQITRIKPTTNKKGQETGFTEEIRDPEGNLLYTLTRSSIRYDKQGNLISYKDPFKFPDKTSLVGTFATKGTGQEFDLSPFFYTLKGTWRSSPNGNQPVEHHLTLGCMRY